MRLRAFQVKCLNQEYPSRRCFGRLRRAARHGEPEPGRGRVERRETGGAHNGRPRRKDKDTLIQRLFAKVEELEKALEDDSEFNAKSTRH